MRESGILMHITSLPGPWGIDTMGVSVYSFVDFLEAEGLLTREELTAVHWGDDPERVDFGAMSGEHPPLGLRPLHREATSFFIS